MIPLFYADVFKLRYAITWISSYSVFHKFSLNQFERVSFAYHYKHKDLTVILCFTTALNPTFTGNIKRKKS